VEKISVVINVVDEETEYLPRVLKSIKNLADEIVLVDMTIDHQLGNTKLKGNSKLKIYPVERLPYVELARNFGISKAQGDWILLLDPDEELQSSLCKRLKEIVKNSQADYFRIPRKNVIFGKWIKHSRWWPDYNIRFFKKSHVTWSEVIHSVPETHGKGFDLEEKEKYAIIHHHYETVEQFVERMNRYTTAHAKLKITDGYKFVWNDLIRKPANEFLSRYFQGEGYKDGLHGLALAGLQALSEFVMYLKIWQKEKFRDQKLEIGDVVDVMKEVESDLHYWKADTLLKETGGIKHRIKRKFRLP
jgi:(heptosyl)LPS beta-1,4-glucosyltransferase